MEANVHCLNHFDAIEGLQHCVRCGRVFCSDCLVSLSGMPYCAVCKTEQALDVQSGVNPMQAQYAHLGRRFLALIIDAIIVGIPVRVVTAMIQAGMLFTKNPAFPLMAAGIGIIISIAANVIYEALMLLKRNGQTIGKQALQIRVVRVDGSPLSPREAWLRPVVRFFTAALCAADYFPAFFTNEKTCIHDMAANTRVINA
jgi:uncharacterized RDD family membrane protein YckC